MKTKIIGTVMTLCLVGLLSVISGCVEVDPSIGDLGNESEEQNTTRAGGERSYYFYDHDNKKVYLSLNTKYAFLSVGEAVLPKAISKYDVKMTEFRVDYALKKQKAIANDRFYTEISFNKPMSDEQYLMLLSDIQSNNEDALVAPYFNDEYGNKIGLSNLFYVKLKDEGDVAILEKTAKDMGCVIVSRDEFMPLWFTLSVTDSSKFNALENAIFFHESGLFSSSEPDLTADITLSNDTYFRDQYYLRNTGQNGGTAGVDINIEPAWQISTGDGVTIAVIDSGVDLEHDDLKANKHSYSFDAESGTTPQRIWGSHGTAVAGIAIAVKDNGKTIAGVAPNSKIMAISYNLTANTNTRQ